MDQQNSFSSDSTYCSVYENSKKISKNRKRMKSQPSSKILEKIYNDVLLHLEGITLLGNLEVARYMTKISGLKLRAREKTTAEKVRMSLFKIYKYPVEHCGVTQDIQMFQNNDEKELKPISIPCIDSSKSYSFQSDMLTNKNFLPESPLQSIKTSVKHVNEELKKNSEMKISNKVCEQNVYLNSPDMFLSQDNKHEEKPKDPNVIYQRIEGVQVSTVTSANPQTLSEKLSRNQIEMNISNHSSLQFPDSNVIKADMSSSYSGDTEVFLESCSTSFNDTMFKVPVFKYKRKRKHRRTEQTNFSITNSTVKGNSRQDHIEQEIQNTTTNSVRINKSDQFQLNEPTVISEHFIRSKDDQENSDTDTTLSDNELQSPQSTNLFVSQYSKSSNFKLNCSNKPKNYATSHEKTTLTNETQTTQSLLELVPESEIKELSQKDSELLKMALKIHNMNDRCFQRVNLFSDVIPESNYTQTEITQQIDFDTVKTMGNSFVEIYNKKIEKVQYDIGNNTKSWEEIKEELDYASEINKNTMGELSDMFEKVSMDERKTIEKLHIKKLEGADFLELDEEDAKELDIKSLRLSNEVRLKELSIYFKRKLMEEENKSVDDSCEDYTEYYTKLIDWRKL